MRYFSYKYLAKQNTLGQAFSLSALSFNKKRVMINCQPAPADSGLVFKINNQLIPVHYKYFQQTEFHTTVLARGQQSILTVEHLLSALWGMQIHNALIEIINDNHLPLLDGSSSLYVKKIKQAGVKIYNQPLKIIKVTKPWIYQSASTDSLAVFLPAEELTVKIIIDFSNLIGQQIFQLNCTKQADYQKQISRARTFLIKIFSQKRWRKIRSQLPILPANPQQAPIITYSSKEYLTKLRYANEPVRHKILDFIGDSALLGMRLQGQIFIYKPGHYFTYRLVKKIDQLMHN